MNAERAARLKTLILLALPAIAEQLLMTMVSYVDTAMVGKVGPSATAAVGLVSSSIWLCNGFLTGVGVGYSVLVANAVGAKEYDRARQVMAQGLIAAVAAGTVMLAIVQLLAGQLPIWLGGDWEVAPQATAYLRFYGLGLPFSSLVTVLSAIFRCLGDTKTPLVFNTAANLLNVVFNFFFIYPTRQVTFWGVSFTIPGAGLGVAGAAAASALAFAISGLLILRSMFDGRRALALSRHDDYRPNGAIIRQAARLALPYMAERLTINLGQIATTRVIASLDTVAVAANHVAVVAEGLCYLPAYGVSAAATALVGQSVGAKNREDAKSYGALAGVLGFGICACTGLCLFLFARPLASLFSEETAVIDLAAQVLRIVSVSEPLFATFIVLSGALRGAHDVRFPMVLALACMWGVRVLLAPILVFQFHIGLAGVWTAMACDLVFRGLLCTWRWRSGRWMKSAGLAPTADMGYNTIK